MKDAVFSYLKNKRELILPFILNIILCTAIYSVYQINFLSLWTVGVILVSAVFYRLCEFINKHNFTGGVCICVVSIALVSVFFRLIAGNDYGMTFREWFLTGAEQINTRFEYLLAILVSFVPFFSVVTYYFTNMLYRMGFLTLTSLIPCALYVKVISEINIVYVCLIAILNIAIFMTIRRKEQHRDARTVGVRAELVSACLFAFILLGISAVIPKEDEARYYDRFEELFMDSGLNGKKVSDYTRFSDYSGNADDYRDFSNVRLYTVYGEEPLPYFKRQTFDYYDFSVDRWYGDSDYSDVYLTNEEWSETSELLSLSGLQEAIKAADGYEAGFAEKYHMERLAEYEQISDPIKQIFVQPEDFEAMYYLSTSRTARIESRGQPEQIYVTRSGVFRSSETPVDGLMYYTILLHDDFAPKTIWQELGGCDFDNDTCTDMLTELEDILERNGDPLAANAEAFLQVHLDAAKYKEITIQNTEQVSDRIKALAEELTEDCVYDWQKATALQNYFLTGDFVYDLRYIAADTSPEYFLFESQRGSCSDFASAFVLMARSVGLTVRYTEGFSSDITSREGVYVIRDNGSHAYPEVYIQNTGWVVFEPTVASEYNELLLTDSDNTNGFSFVIDVELVTAVISAAGIILLGVLFATLLYPLIEEKKYVKKMRFASNEECIRMAYVRFLKKTAPRLIKKASSLTPYEAVTEFEKVSGCDIGELAFMMEKVTYGGKTADDSEKTAAVDCYDRAKTAAKEYIKEKNKAGRKSIK